MDRRGFLTFALGAAAGAVVIPELVTPTRRWFLPPAGGWLSRDHLYVQKRLTAEDIRRMRDALERQADRITNPPLIRRYEGFDYYESPLGFSSPEAIARFREARELLAKARIIGARHAVIEIPGLGSVSYRYD